MGAGMDKWVRLDAAKQSVIEWAVRVVEHAEPDPLRLLVLYQAVEEMKAAQKAWDAEQPKAKGT